MLSLTYRHFVFSAIPIFSVRQLLVRTVNPSEAMSANCCVPAKSIEDEPFENEPLLATVVPQSGSSARDNGKAPNGGDEDYLLVGCREQGVELNTVLHTDYGRKKALLICFLLQSLLSCPLMQLSTLYPAMIQEGCVLYPHSPFSRAPNVISSLIDQSRTDTLALIVSLFFFWIDCSVLGGARVKLDALYNSGTALMLFLAFPSGIVFDTFGPNFVAVVGCVFSGVGLAGMATGASVGGAEWLLYAGYPFCNVGGVLQNYGERLL